MKPYLVSIEIGNNPPVKDAVFVQAKCPKEAACEAANTLIPYDRRFGEVTVTSLHSGRSLAYHRARSHRYFIEFSRSITSITKS